MKKGHKPPTPEKLMIPDYWDEHDRKAHMRKTKSDVAMLCQAFRSAGLNVKENKSEEYL